MTHKSHPSQIEGVYLYRSWEIGMITMYKAIVSPQDGVFITGTLEDIKIGQFYPFANDLLHTYQRAKKDDTKTLCDLFEGTTSFLEKYPASAYDHRMNRLIPEEEQRIHRLITHEYTLKDLASYALRHITHPKDVYNLGWGLNEDLFAIFKKIYPHTFKKNPFRKIEFLD